MTGQRAAETLYETEALLRLVERELDELSGEDPLPGSTGWGGTPQPRLGLECEPPMIVPGVLPGGSLQSSLRDANREISELLHGFAASLDPARKVG